MNAVLQDGRRALELSLSEGHIEFVKVLLQNGADANGVNLGILLKTNGADAYASQAEDRRAKYFAAHGGRVDVLKLLIQNGADVNRVNSRFPKSAIHWAAKMGHDACALLLLCF